MEVDPSPVELSNECHPSGHLECSLMSDPEAVDQRATPGDLTQGTVRSSICVVLRGSVCGSLLWSKRDLPPLLDCTKIHTRGEPRPLNDLPGHTTRVSVSTQDSLLWSFHHSSLLLRTGERGPHVSSHGLTDLDRMDSVGANSVAEGSQKGQTCCQLNTPRLPSVTRTQWSSLPTNPPHLVFLGRGLVGLSLTLT